jgi:O-acetyl-ADP-ribose deacetylase
VTKVCAPIEEAAPLVPAAPPPLFGNATEEGKFVMGLMTSFKVQLGRSNAVLYLAFDTVLNFTGDAIVNAANEGCVGGGGIDGEVNHRGGCVIEEARRAASSATGWPLQALRDGRRQDHGRRRPAVLQGDPCRRPALWLLGDGARSRPAQVLESAYKNSMERARENQLKSVGFCILPAGIFRGACPLSVVIKTGIDAIAKHAYPGLETVVKEYRRASAVMDLAARILRRPDGLISYLAFSTRCTALHTACYHGNLGALETLLEHCADPQSALHPCGATPLHNATVGSHQHHAVIARLLAAGASADATDRCGRSAEHWAMRRGGDDGILQALRGASRIAAATKPKRKGEGATVGAAAR